MFDPQKHNYFKKLMKFIAENQPPAGRISEIDICHDDRCRIYRGGYCNCQPDIMLRRPDRN